MTGWRATTNGPVSETSILELRLLLGAPAGIDHPAECEAEERCNNYPEHDLASYVGHDVPSRAVNSMRRLRARPADVSFESVGFNSP